VIKRGITVPNDSKPKKKLPPFMVALYLRGDELDPEAVTELLEVSPTEALRKGEKRYGTEGREYVNQVGIWTLKAATDSHSLNDHIQEVISKFKTSHIDFSGIAGAEEAHIAVFLCYTKTGRSACEFEFDITNENITEIGRLGLSLEFSVYSLEESEETPATESNRDG